MKLKERIFHPLNHMIFSAVFWLLVLTLVSITSLYLPTEITVSNNTTKRELPIYCVETDKPQVTLSFDTAWGDDKYGFRTYSTQNGLLFLFITTITLVSSEQ